jgi:hypothetical protein
VASPRDYVAGIDARAAERASDGQETIAAFVTLTPEAALAAARQADSELARAWIAGRYMAFCWRSRTSYDRRCVHDSEQPRARSGLGWRQRCYGG